MSERLLLISATRLEAAPLHQAMDWKVLEFPLGELYTHQRLYLAHLGLGKVNTAAGLALAIERLKPTTVIQFGIGGAYVNSFLSIGMMMVATHDIHIDSGVRTAEGFQLMEQVGFPLLSKGQPYYNIFPTDQALTQKLSRRLGLPTGIFATSETITGSFEESTAIQARFDASIESMEGAAAAHVCLALNVPFAEIRSVSNIAGERDKRNWDIPKAVKHVNDIILEMLRHDDSYSR